MVNDASRSVDPLHIRGTTDRTGPQFIIRSPDPTIRDPARQPGIVARSVAGAQLYPMPVITNAVRFGVKGITLLKLKFDPDRVANSPIHCVGASVFRECWRGSPHHRSRLVQPVKSCLCGSRDDDGIGGAAGRVYPVANRKVRGLLQQPAGIIRSPRDRGLPQASGLDGQ